MSRRAEMGVGTLIIFIALLLVAAVAAGVLLQTAGSLQQKALMTGGQSRAEISTNARVIEVSATNGSTQTVQFFHLQLKLSPGSDSIKLSDVMLSLDTDNTSTTLLYLERFNASTYCVGGVLASDCYGTADDVGNFTVEYLINGSNHLEGNLQRGDVIRMYFASPRAVGEDEQVRINFIPKIGTATLVEFNTPDVMSTERVYLYP